MNEERLHILKMLEEGKITVEEATQLITAVETSSVLDQNSANSVDSTPEIELAAARPHWDAEADETDEAESAGPGLRLPLDNLSSTHFRGAILYGARFEGTNLFGANLRDANLRQADCREADLTGVNLHGANFQGVDLEDADLTGANLHDADFRGANLRGKSLIGVDLSGFKYRNNMLESPGV